MPSTLKVCLYVEVALNMMRLYTAMYKLVHLDNIQGCVTLFRWDLEVTLDLACSYPDMVERLLPFCGSARTSDHNKVWLYDQSKRKEEEKLCVSAIIMGCS